MRSFLFATKVLLVDGPTDWEVVRCIFTKHNILQNDANVKNTSQKKKMGGCWEKSNLNCESLNWETLSTKELKKIF